MEKHFADPADWTQECTIHHELRGWSGCAELLYSDVGVIRTRWYPGGTVLEELLRQNINGFNPQVWTALADWVLQCHHRCGMLPSDGNLRNFLWSEGRIIGIDLESYRPMTEAECAAEVIANLLHYDSVADSLKQQAAALLQQQLAVSGQAIQTAEEALLQRRKSKTRQSCSGIILAGGRSSRMGQDKARLPLMGESMLQRQIRKLQCLGIQDILISGTEAPEGTRSVPDIYPGRGPLGGLHACLQAAENPCCLVLSVDVPLLPAATLERLCRSHKAGITVLSHDGCDEPLVGVYDKGLYAQIEPLIKEQGAPVRKLAQLASWNRCFYLGPEAYLYNCNTPEDYLKVQEILESFSRWGLDFL